MSGLLPALFECPTSRDQCGPSIGGSFLFGFLLTSWAFSDRAHNTDMANESHFIMSKFLLRDSKRDAARFFAQSWVLSTGKLLRIFRREFPSRKPLQISPAFTRRRKSSPSAFACASVFG